MSAQIAVVDPVAQARLDELIPVVNGQQQPVPASLLKGQKQQDIAVFCVRHGLYQVITAELVSFCRKVIGGRRAIEIGAGRGSLGAALNIPQTDSHLVQSRQDIRSFYESIGEQVTPLPRAVERLDAVQAIKNYQPKIVVGCWVTQLGNTAGSSSPYGVDEGALLGEVDTYLLVGNINVHGGKAILSRPHTKVHQGASWLVSRASAPEKNAIWMWGGP